MKKEEIGSAVFANSASRAIRSGKKEEIESAISELQRIRRSFLNSSLKNKRVSVSVENSPIYQIGIIDGIINTLFAVNNFILIAKEEYFLKRKNILKILELAEKNSYEMDFVDNGPEKIRTCLGMGKQEFHRLCNKMLKYDLLVRVRYGIGYNWNLGYRGLILLKAAKAIALKK